MLEILLKCQPQEQIDKAWEYMEDQMKKLQSM